MLIGHCFGTECNEETRLSYPKSRNITFMNVSSLFADRLSLVKRVEVYELGLLHPTLPFEVLHGIVIPLTTVLLAPPKDTSFIGLDILAVGIWSPRCV